MHTAAPSHDHGAHKPGQVAEVPLGSYAGFLAAYGVGVTGAALALRRRGGFPERIGAADLALITVATHKLSRLIAKESVTRPLRAPFTTFVEAAGAAELNEEVEGTGLRKAVGEWITCPFCLGQWLATAMTFGMVVAPRPTRLAATVLTAVAGSDMLQLVYAGARARVEPPSS